MIHETNESQTHPPALIKNIFQKYRNIIVPLSSELLEQYKQKHIPPSTGLPLTPISPALHSLSTKGGELTVGEIEGELLHIGSNNDQLISYYYNRGGVIYPNIIVSNVEDSNECGIFSLLEKPPAVPIYSFSPPMQWFNTMYDSLQKLTPYLPYLQSVVPMKVPEHMMVDFYESNKSNGTATSNTGGDIQDDSSSTTMETTNWNNIKCIEWHPCNMQFSVVLDNEIYFYDVMLEEWSNQVLRHDFHRKISTMKYKPTNKPNESILAVGCEHGIVLWDVNRRLNENIKDVTRNGICIFLQTNSHVTSLDWSKDGQILASSGLNDHSIRLWRFMDNDWRCFKTITKYNGGIRHLSFNRYLLVTTITNVFRIYETSDWTSEKWNCFDQPVKSYSWSHDGQYLFIVTENSDQIHVLKDDSVLQKESTSVHFEYHCSIPLCEYEQFKTQLGGCIRQVQLHRERLIVSFENSPLLACIQVATFNGQLTCRPIGYIRGPSKTLLESRATKDHDFDPFSQAIDHTQCNAFHLQFWANFPKGSLLSVCWRGKTRDKISIYPFYYDRIDSWNVLYDDNNQFYRTRLNKIYERLDDHFVNPSLDFQQSDEDDEPALGSGGGGFFD